MHQMEDSPYENQLVFEDNGMHTEQSFEGHPYQTRNNIAAAMSSLPESYVVNWDDWLQPSDNNFEPKNELPTGLPFFSAYNQLDKYPYSQQSPGYSPNFYDSRSEGVFSYGLHNTLVSTPMSSQVDLYQKDPESMLAIGGASSQTSGAMGEGTYTQILRPPLTQSDEIDHKVPTFHIVLNSQERLGSEKPARKIRRDKGMKRGPNRKGEFNTEQHDTICEDVDSGNKATKRKRSLEDIEESDVDTKEAPRKDARCRLDYENMLVDKSKWNDSTRPKWSRKDGHPNIKFRCIRRQQNETREADNGNVNPSYSLGPSKLFDFLETSKKKKSQSKKSKTPPYDGAEDQGGTAVTSNTASVANASERKANRMPRRREVSVDKVRGTAPEGWDPYENEFYSGDDNISDDELEVEGKSSAYRPPRMACRRCNKLKHTCDHQYPSCSHCAKYNQRCRYRDDLTGRQIRPGQLEEVEAAYHYSRQENKRLDGIVEAQEQVLAGIMDLVNAVGDDSSSQTLQDAVKAARSLVKSTRGVFAKCCS